ncbi:uncharacterized protein BP5553_00482 [Venustampulla echinocandica]|uniref:Zn(2)-C6 fungal-type domain-containing protein n=1 Tax=Venustampulla echinocandica TaxID=2656787 RepID=A0A370TYB5_9HELO|nr:uncharacterized protein BP5553_00482 [Venustampulla echinocandica]RDL40503.1 hypothetical protein BP5553_00482 [Venustampulla echinocandica]
MNTEISRRSACDRCRGQKLRCVRISKLGDGPWEGPSHPGDGRFEPCERCLKAGTECINTVTTHRNHPRAERLQSLNLTSSFERTASHSPFSLNTNTYQHSFGIDSGSSDGRRKEGSLRILESASVHQPRTNFQQPFEERPKWRSIEPSPNGLGISNADQLGSLSPHQDIRSRNERRTSSSNSPSTCQQGIQTFSTDDNPASKRHNSFSVDNFDFGIIINPENTTHHDATAALMNILSTSGHDAKDASSRNPTPENTQQPSDKSGAQTVMIESKGDYLNRLSELSSQLLKDFSRTSSANLSDVLSFSPCCNSWIGTCTHSSQKSMRLKNTIGSVLEGSQRFLDILQHLKEPSPTGSFGPSSSAGSECSYSEYWEENDFMSINNEHPYSTNAMAVKLSDLATEQAHAGKMSDGGTMDMPTTLTILTCYTWLLQSYEGIFSRIYTYLLSQPKLPLQSIPAILPGLHIGGFDLGDRKDLQMEILIQVSSRMLERIEETLGITVISPPQDSQDNSPNRRGILDRASASALLDIMFKQKDLGYSKGDNGRVPSVKQTMDNIRGVLRRNGW